MTKEHDEEYYISLWTKVREKFLLASKLDPPQEEKPDLYARPSRLIFGASLHNYRCQAMTEKEIQLYEKQLGISFPINFRTYISLFGIDSGGPGYGISSKRIVINPETVTALCPLEPRPGVGFVSTGEDVELGEDEYSFQSEHVMQGTIDIGTSGNPTSHHLVVGGKNSGDVFTYNWEMLFYQGEKFETWYEKWLDTSLEKLHQGNGGNNS